MPQTGQWHPQNVKILICSLESVLVIENSGPQNELKHQTSELRLQTDIRALFWHLAMSEIN